jgi:hypothetical protein
MNKDIFKPLTKEELLNKKKRLKEDKPIKEVKEKKCYKKKFIPYHDQLIDKRWMKKREQVFKLKGRKCSVCGATHNLQIHHLRYFNDKYAWEYKMKDLVVMCESCHKRKHCIDLDERLDFLLKNEL